MFGTNTAFIIARLLINLHFHKYTLPIWYICANKKIILKHNIKLKNKRLSRRNPVKILWQAKKVIESLERRQIASKNANVVCVYVLTNWAIDLGCWFKSHWGLNFIFLPYFHHCLSGVHDCEDCCHIYVHDQAYYLAIAECICVM